MFDLLLEEHSLLSLSAFIFETFYPSVVKKLPKHCGHFRTLPVFQECVENVVQCIVNAFKIFIKPGFPK